LLISATDQLSPSAGGRRPVPVVKPALTNYVDPRPDGILLGRKLEIP
jgi:hypothetical protein